MASISSLGALAEPTGLAIFQQLRKGPRSVTELASAVPVSQPAVSQHLRTRREAGLVTCRKEGNRRMYSLRLEGLSELRSFAEDV